MVDQNGKDVQVNEHRIEALEVRIESLNGVNDRLKTSIDDMENKLGRLSNWLIGKKESGELEDILYRAKHRLSKNEKQTKPNL